MKHYISLLLINIIFFTTITKSCSSEYLYILNENSINSLYSEAKKTIKTSEIIMIKDVLGLILRFEIKHPDYEYYHLSKKTIQNLKNIEKFLAKNKNPVIIEVHTDENNLLKESKIKNWELSTVISNKIEKYILNNFSDIKRNDIYSIGYGEFLPSKNTPNNGGKYNNRVDIIILCSMNGE